MKNIKSHTTTSLLTLAVFALLAISFATCFAAPSDLAPPALAPVATPAAPFGIFYAGDPLSFTVTIKDPGNLPSKIPLVVRQLRAYNYAAIADQVQTAAYAGRTVCFPCEKVGEGEADVAIAGNTAKLTFTLDTKRLGALRVFAVIDGNEVKLTDFLHVLPPNDVPASQSVFAVSPQTYFNQPEVDRTFARLARAGIKVVRWETGERYKQGSDTDFDFSLDLKGRDLLVKNKMSAFVIIGHDDNNHLPKWPNGQVLTYGGGAPETQPTPDRLPEFARWCGQYATVMKGPIRGYEFFNEPWEDGSISGAIGGGANVRRLILAGAPKIHKADPTAKCVAACSIMNAEDSYLPYVDVMAQLDGITVHTYFNFMDYSEAICSRIGKEVWDTESWWSAYDDSAPDLLAHQVHRGYKMIEPCGGGMDITNEDGEHCTCGSATFITAQRFLDGMHGAGVAMKGHCPVILLYEGRGHALAFLQSVAIADGGPQFGSNTGNIPYDRLEEIPVKEKDYKPIGQYKIATPSGVHAYDVFGNEIPASNGSLTIPVGRFGYYVEAPNLAVLKSTMEAGVLTGVKPFDLAIHDFTQRLAPGAKLRVDVTNVYAETEHADVTVDGGDWMSFESPTVSLDLKAGEQATAVFVVKAAKLNAVNHYPIAVTAQGHHGITTLTETINQAVVVRGTPKAIDGDLSEWDAFNPVPVFLDKNQNFATGVLAYQKLPFEEESARDAKAYFVQAEAMYDDQYFYFAAKVNDPTENRRESVVYGERYHTFPWPNQHLYMGAPEMTGVTGDTIDLGFNTNDDNTRLWNYLMPNDPLYRVYPWPDTDFEFEVYPVKYNERADEYMKHYWQGNTPWVYPESEVWRLWDPKMLFRHHAYPFNPPTRAYDQGLAPGAKSVVRRVGNVWIYEVAIPWAQIWELKPAPGSIFKFAFYTRDNSSHGLEYAYRKSVSVLNHSFHPTWEQFYSNDTQWGFE